MAYISESICKISKQRQDNYNDYYFYPQKDETFKKEAFEDKIVIIKIFNENKQLIDEFNINVNTFWKSDVSTQIRTTTRKGQDISKKYNNSKIISFPKRYLDKFDISNFFTGETEPLNNQIYSPGLTIEDWKNLFQDKEILKHNGMRVLKLMYQNGSEASCKQLSILDGNVKDANYYKGQGQSLAMLVFNKTDCKKPELRNGSTEWYSILFKTRKTRTEEEGSIVWQMRGEIKMAIKELNLFNEKEFKMNVNIPLNLILYGPPGTGKTYNTVIKAIEIINPNCIEYNEKGDIVNYFDVKKEFDKAKNNYQIEFVTFHQSYSYEEFVEGIKPYILEWGESNVQDVKYVGNDGVFKKLCQRAEKKLYKKKGDVCIRYAHFEDVLEEFKNKYPVGVDFGNLHNLKYSKNYVEYQYGKQKTYRKIELDKIKNMFDEEYEYDTAIEFNNDYDGNSALACYHYTFYKELNNIRNEINAGIQHKIRKDDSGEFEINAQAPRHVLIIDEINRGDVSKIFGELITLIEEDKRIGEKHQMKVTLPYSKEQFGVPNNLYIIGTMNTADRSIALLDTALRRRFDFEEMMPRPELLRGQVVKEINLEILLTKINERITDKYDKDHQIGHSYLMDVKTGKQLERAYKNRILPLLNEYFYNDSQTVGKILNCKKYANMNYLDVLKEAQKEDNKETDDEE